MISSQTYSGPRFSLGNVGKILKLANLHKILHDLQVRGEQVFIFSQSVLTFLYRLYVEVLEHFLPFLTVR